ncbi:hypothetical protein [Pseudofrankia saprophytica]|uniref:hypothetical protein n=1 Tax=Pseudofrankia saprophytica TaxID=298655 RepID=UPI000234D845|nr:hypothetical protein [Pseudofrankia saprophytica]
MAFAAESAFDRASQQATAAEQADNSAEIHQPFISRYQSAIWPRRVVVTATVGALLGGVLGLGLSHLGGSKVHAASEVLVAPDPPLLGDSQQVTSETAQRFVQNQVLVVSSDEFQAEVAARLGLPDVTDFQVTQVALTDVMRISVTADDENQARRIADTAATLYAADRQRTSAARYTAAIGGVEQRAGTLAVQLRDFPATSGPGQEAQLQALSTQYQQLLGQEEQLRLAADQTTGLVEIVKRGTVTSTDGPSSVMVGLLAMLGALAGFGLAMLRRRRRRVIYRADDLGDLAIQPTTVLPNLAGWRSPATRRRRLAAADRAVRLHLNQRAGLDGPIDLVIAVLAVAPGVGGTFVARRFMASAARRGAEVVDDSTSTPENEPRLRPTVKIVDSPVLSSSGEAIQAARGADVLVLVVGLGRSTYDEVRDALLELTIAGVAPHGVVLNEPPLHRRRRSSTRTGRPLHEGLPAQQHPMATAPVEDPIPVER